MKVISTTKDGYLVDISRNEFSILTTDESYNKFQDYTILGKKYDLFEIWNHAHRTKKMLDEITTIQIKLRKLADEIEPIKQKAEIIKGE